VRPLEENKRLSVPRASGSIPRWIQTLSKPGRSLVDFSTHRPPPITLCFKDDVSVPTSTIKQIINAIGNFLFKGTRESSLKTFKICSIVIITLLYTKFYTIFLHILYSSPYVIRATKSRTRWTEHVARMREMRTKFWSENLKGSDNSEDLDVDRIISGRILGK
jgi:hypothetical protein